LLVAKEVSHTAHERYLRLDGIHGSPRGLTSWWRCVVSIIEASQRPGLLTKRDSEECIIDQEEWSHEFEILGVPLLNIALSSGSPVPGPGSVKLTKAACDVATQ
jgi:hypothetical protein